MTNRRTTILAGILGAIILGALFGLAVANRDTAPPWCTYPDPPAVTALNAHVDAELADIHRYSPDVHGDRLTLQAAALAECGPFRG
jgi:hypothetical protein